MNRLVIIGNGFDLAHGLPTSYRDFMDDFWKTVCDTKGLKKITYNSELVDVDCEFGGMYSTFDYETIDNINSYEELKKFVDRNIKKGYGNFLIKFHNDFFKIICEENLIYNWVDIENLYYDILKSISNNSFKKYNYSWGVNRLNNEFGEVKSLLEKYLIDNIEEKFEFNPNDVIEILNIFKPKIYIGNELDEFYNEISIKSKKRIKEEYQAKVQKSTGFITNNFSGQKIHITDYFLCFNYTSTMKRYIDFLKVDIEDLNEIHGSIIDELNPINFGFGDEMDDDYKQIEDKNDNEYLKNIKSFQYLHTHNYKRLLNVIDSDLFQVYLMGHSCGLSDRTLLNTIFEHENCCSIKIYYHQKEDGSDNYTEITQNISRHFNDKKLMREKIVNKTLCQPLPQIQLPKNNICSQSNKSTKRTPK